MYREGRWQYVALKKDAMKLVSEGVADGRTVIISPAPRNGGGQYVRTLDYRERTHLLQWLAGKATGERM